MLWVTDRHPIERPWKLKKGAKYLNSGLLQTLKQASLERSVGNFGLKLESSLVLSVASLSLKDDSGSHLKMLRILGGLDVTLSKSRNMTSNTDDLVNASTCHGRI